MSSLFLKITKDFESKKENEFDKRTITMYVQNTSGEYALSNSNTFPTDGYELNLEKSSCTNGGVLSQNSETKKINVTISSTDSCVLYFDKEKHKFSLNEIIASSKEIVSNFNSAVTTAVNSGVYQMADDYRMSYYREVVENNYVKFAGFYWRIIRVNGNGSLRIIYDGTSAHTNGESNIDRLTHTDNAYNANYSDAKYIGWMYGPTGMATSTSKTQAQTNTDSSTIKTVVDSWYKTNIEDKGYGNAVADIIFCNDRSTASNPKMWWTGEGTNATVYGAFSRFLATNTNWSSTPSPKFTCDQKNDSFTVSDTTKGNGALTYPVGLITADEISSWIRKRRNYKPKLLSI